MNDRPAWIRALSPADTGPTPGRHRADVGDRSNVAYYLEGIAEVAAEQASGLGM